MKRNKFSLLIWALFAIVTLVAIYGLILQVRDLPAASTLLDVLETVIWGLLTIEFAFLAALIVSQRPDNTIGWLLMFPALAFTMGLFTENYLACLCDSGFEQFSGDFKLMYV